MESPWPLPPRPGLFSGEAIVLWRLAHGERRVVCFVVEWPAGYWLGVECSAGELQVSETLTAMGDVVGHADVLKAQFLAEGWNEEAPRAHP